MKRLAVMRHAEAIGGGVDYERALSDFGMKEAARSAQQLSQIINPDKVLVSGAVRTRMTADILKSEMQLQDQLFQFDDKIYDASVDDLFTVIGKLSDSVDEAVLVGHNPGVSMFVTVLTTKRFVFSTASFAVLEFDADSWRAVSKGRILKTFSP